MHLKAVYVKTLDNSKDYLIKEFQEQYSSRGIHAFAGIGNPSRFFKMLRELGFEVSEHAFADHHKFSKADFSVVTSGALILMTEKDAVKCRSLALENAWFIPVETHLPVEFERIINQQLIKLTQDRQT